VTDTVESPCPLDQPGLAAVLASLSSENRGAIFVIPRIFDSRTTVLAASGLDRARSPFQSHPNSTAPAFPRVLAAPPRGSGDSVSRHARASRLAGHFVPRSLFEVSLRSTSLLLGHALSAAWNVARAGERARQGREHLLREG